MNGISRFSRFVGYTSLVGRGEGLSQIDFPIILGCLGGAKGFGFDTVEI